MSRIKITAGDVVAFAELNETATAEAIWNALPMEAQANTWGDEIYCSIPVHRDEENAQEVVERATWAIGLRAMPSASSSAARPLAMAMKSDQPAQSMSSGVWRVILPYSRRCAAARRYCWSGWSRSKPCPCFA